MYYEIHGQGRPLVLIHGGGSTIETSFGNIIPLLAKDRRIIAMELQAHGRTSDRNADLSFEQDADDVAALLNNLRIAKADVLGFSNGGQTAIELALRHGLLVNKLILASTFYNRSAAPPQFWEVFEHVTLDMMPQVLKDAFLRVNNRQEGLVNMFNRDVRRMQTFKGWSSEQIERIKAPTFIINGSNDVGSIEHAVEMYRLIPNAQLAVLPGGHGEYIGSAESLDGKPWTSRYGVELISEFLEAD